MRLGVVIREPENWSASQFGCLRECGAEGVVFLLGGARGIPALSVDAVEAAEQAGLKVIVLHGIALDVGDEDDQERAVEQACERLKLTSVSGASGVVLTGGSRSEQSLDVFISGLRDVLAAAADLGMTVHVANGVGTRIEQIEDVRAVVQGVGHPSLRVWIDAGAFYAAAVNPRDVWAETDDLVTFVVLSDRVGRQTVRLGEGRVNLTRLIEDVKRVDEGRWLLVDGPVLEMAEKIDWLKAGLCYVRDSIEAD